MSILSLPPFPAAGFRSNADWKTRNFSSRPVPDTVNIPMIVTLIFVTFGLLLFAVILWVGQFVRSLYREPKLLQHRYQLFRLRDRLRRLLSSHGSRRLKGFCFTTETLKPCRPGSITRLTFCRCCPGVFITSTWMGRK